MLATRKVTRDATRQETAVPSARSLALSKRLWQAQAVRQAFCARLAGQAETPIRYGGWHQLLLVDRALFASHGDGDATMSEAAAMA